MAKKTVSVPCQVYYLYDRKVIVYVGMSCKLRNRIHEHKKTIKFDSYKTFLFDKRTDASTFERQSIMKYNPKYNRTLKPRVESMVAINSKLPLSAIRTWHSYAVENDLNKEQAIAQLIINGSK